MTDPRAADVAEAERLFATVDAEGAARLPALSAVELGVLCGEGQVLAEGEEVLWWRGLGEAEREKMTAAVLDLLTFRKLLRPAEGRPLDSEAAPEDRLKLPMALELATMVAARQRPTLVAVGTRADGSATGTPRMYGLGEQSRPLRALVAEHVTREIRKPFGPMHEFVLLSLHKAGRAFAVWATEADRRGRKSKRQPRTIDVFRHAEGSSLTRDRVVVAAKKQD